MNTCPNCQLKIGKSLTTCPQCGQSIKHVSRGISDKKKTLKKLLLKPDQVDFQQTPRFFGWQFWLVVILLNSLAGIFLIRDWLAQLDAVLAVKGSQVILGQPINPLPLNINLVILISMLWLYTSVTGYAILRWLQRRKIKFLAYLRQLATQSLLSVLFAGLACVFAILKGYPWLIFISILGVLSYLTLLIAIITTFYQSKIFNQKSPIWAVWLFILTQVFLGYCIFFVSI